MEDRYPILLAGQAIGQAAVTRQGLYACFDCRCKLSGQVIYRLTVTCDGRTESLGIPVPDGGSFVLRTQLPLKRLGTGSLCIQAVPRKAELSGRFIPISPEEPFAYLTRLQNAFLAVRGNQKGIVIPEEDF